MVDCTCKLWRRTSIDLCCHIAVKTSVQARLDRRSQAALERMVKHLGWSPSKVVREGVRLLAACGLHPALPISAPTRSDWKDSAGEPVLLDTGAIVALLDRSEQHHEQSVTIVEALERVLVTCEVLIAENC